jgi:hypothetical protein
MSPSETGLVELAVECHQATSAGPRTEETCLPGDLVNFRVAHYSRADACQHRDLLQRSRIGAVAKEGSKMGLQYRVLRARSGRAKREDVGNTDAHISTVDGSDKPWRFAVNMHSSDRSEAVPWLVDALVGQPHLGSSANSSASSDHTITFMPTASPRRAAILSSQGGRDTDAREKQTAVDLDHTRPGNRDSWCVPARTEG